VNVPVWLWLVTVGGLSAVILTDLFLSSRTAHAGSVRDAARWVAIYVALAALFGLGLWYFAGGVPAGEFFSGYLTEYSLSMDNLFVFVIIMSAFAVPAEYQHRVLLVGIVIALVLRGVFIAVGAAAIAAFSWVFYLFAVVLIVTAVKLLREGGGDGHDEEYRENAAVRALRRGPGRQNTQRNRRPDEGDHRVGRSHVAPDSGGVPCAHRRALVASGGARLGVRVRG
jgi:tellurite resistance protein TerC